MPDFRLHSSKSKGKKIVTLGDLKQFDMAHMNSTVYVTINTLYQDQYFRKLLAKTGADNVYDWHQAIMVLRNFINGDVSAFQADMKNIDLDFHGDAITNAGADFFRFLASAAISGDLWTVFSGDPSESSGGYCNRKAILTFT